MPINEYTIRSAVIGTDPRTRELESLEAWYDGIPYLVGEFAEGREYPWEQEHSETERNPDGSKKRIPLERRRPYHYNLAAYVVDTSVGWLFGDSHFPTIRVEGDETASQLVSALSEAVQLQLSMVEAATDGGKCGTAALLFKVIDGYPMLEILPAKYCLPTFKKDGKTLTKLRYQYTAKGSYFLEQRIEPAYELGVEVLDPDADYWYRREITPMGEDICHLVEVSRDGKPPVFVRDDARSVAHNMDVLAAVWIRNLPSKKALDGLSTYDKLRDLFHATNMLLSCAYRTIRRLGDPTVAFTQVTSIEVLDKMVAKLGSSGGGSIATPGDAKMLEINATGQEAALTWLDRLRQAIAEVSHVLAFDPERIKGSFQSARALRLLHGPLLELVGKLRQTYAPELIRLVRLMLEVVGKLQAAGKVVYLPREVEGTVSHKVTIALDWGDYFPQTVEDTTAELTLLTTAVASKLMSLETAQEKAAPLLGIVDVAAERQRIEKERIENPSVQDLMGQGMDGAVGAPGQNEDNPDKEA